ncbi:hypothetical protein F5Y11DRAFT_342382 [Daldinia sp. FL1419]|nr:hypothetical protein F5Y11DRAFT_342382 [Daldinia sp. FL1419]
MHRAHNCACWVWFVSCIGASRGISSRSSSCGDNVRRFLAGGAIRVSLGGDDSSIADWEVDPSAWEVDGKDNPAAIRALGSLSGWPDELSDPPNKLSVGETGAGAASRSGPHRLPPCGGGGG